MGFGGNGLVALAEEALTNHASIPPVFSLAAACSRPDLIAIALGIWAKVRGCAEASAVADVVDIAVKSQWVCDPYGLFLPFILHAGYSIGTGFTDTFDAAKSDVKVEGSQLGYIAAPRDKAMLVLLCAASPHLPADTPLTILKVKTLLKNYI